METKTALTYEDWKEMGVKIKEVGEFIQKINCSYRKRFPKRIQKINKLFTLLKCELDSQVCSEYEADSVVKIFYGPKE